MEQTFLNWTFAVLIAGGGWWMKATWEGLKELQGADRSLIDRVAAIDLLVAGSYIKRDHFETKMTEFSTAIFNKLDKIEDKLDRKADKAFGP
jgi:hypothetical protein